jgi:ketosteroid isomerase-like protein
VPVPSEQVATVLRINDAFNRRDTEEILRDLDSDAELAEWPDAPGARTFHGPEGMRRAFEGWFETWEWMHVDVEEVEEAGDRVMATVFQRARGSASGAEVTIRAWNVYEFRGGKVWRLLLFTDRKSATEALQASGLEGAKTSSEETA